jgi:predicted Fe-Mo cluster-binding NifX family protein
MKIALPLTATAEFATHYGAAVQFIVYEVEPQTRTILRRIQVRPAENRPCHWPVLLRTAGTDLVLAGGMGRGARQHMAEHGVKVLAGVPAADPEALVAGWLAGTLVTGENACGGGHEAGEGHCHGHAHGAAHEHESGCGCAH